MKQRTIYQSLLTLSLLCLATHLYAEMPEQAATVSNDPTAPTTKGIIDINNHTRPDDATQLVGEEGHILIPEPGKASKWSFADGILTATKGWDSLYTPRAYGDFMLHVEFNINPPKANRILKNREAEGNSGVYIQQRYEVQIQNAHGIPEDEFKASYGASLYKLKKPDRLVSKPAGQWQTYDIVFRAARFDGETKTQNARITVYHNGVLVHDDYELPRKTGAGKKEGPEPMALKFQGHANPVKFRNIWVKPLELD